MPSNPKTSKWFSAARTKRKRKGIEIMLSDEARGALDEMAPRGLRSTFIERLILSEWVRQKKERDRA